MKRVFLGVLIVSLILPALFGAAGAASEFYGSGFSYLIHDDGTAGITGCKNMAAALLIPESLDGHLVTAIEASAFRDSSGLESVNIPQAVAGIGEQAFYNCTSLKKIFLPAGLKKIGGLAFAYCGNLTSAAIPEGTEEIGEYAFGDCGGLLSASLPASITLIGADAFYGVSPEFRMAADEGSAAWAYARDNGLQTIPLADFQPDAPEETAAETPESPESADEVGPETVTDTDAEPEPAGGQYTFPYTVRFPFADREGTYTGDASSGVPQGQGSFTATNAADVRWTYTGEWDNGAMSGNGEMEWSDGLMFRGQYSNNQPYQGEWLTNGDVVYRGGFMMCGNCGAIVFDGSGKLSDRTGRTIFEGKFESGFLVETAQERGARAQALDPQCAQLTADGYAAVLKAGAAADSLVKLDGRVLKVVASEDHGYGEYILSSASSGGMPVSVCYRFGKGEERPAAGNRMTVWGAASGVYRETDGAGNERAMPQVDAHVMALADETPAAGAAEAALTVYKALEGRALKNGEFTFTLDSSVTVIEKRTNPIDGTTVFVPVTYTARLQTAANRRDGTIVFDPIRFRAEDIGRTYTYTITEVAGFETGMTYDPMALTVTALVLDSGGGTPLVLLFYPDDTTFNNSFAEASVQVTLEAEKTLAGRTLEEGEFSFLLVEGVTTLQTAFNDAAGKVSFAPVEYTPADIGKTFRYNILEFPGTLPGITYDTASLPVEVSVWLDADGRPAATTSYPKGIGFTNVFQAACVIDISFNVELAGRELKNGEFTFSLEENGAVIGTKRNNREGVIRFDPLTFTEADIGTTRTYTIRQEAGSEAGMVYDTAEKTVTVSVGYDGKGGLAVEAGYPAGVTFSNAYTAPAAPLALSAVDVNKTSVNTGATVSWKPRVEGGVPPYRYSYRLFKDGKEYRDAGWLETGSKAFTLNKAGVYQMQVVAEDAEGTRTEAVLSPKVTVTKPWSPQDLSGSWEISLTVTEYKPLKEGSTNSTPLPATYPQTWTVVMQDDAGGTVSSSWEGFSGTLAYEDGMVKAVLTNTGCTDTYEGQMTIEDGTVTFSGSWFEKQEKCTYSGTWTAVIAI